MQNTQKRNEVERTNDRRKFTWRSVWGTFKHGRRKNANRADDKSYGHFSDVHESKSLVAHAIALVILNILDVTSTLFIISNGGMEANPLMDMLIQFDITVFIIAKMGFISLGLIALYWHRHFSVLGIMRTRHLIQGLCYMYAALIIYHGTLIYTIFTR